MYLSVRGLLLGPSPPAAIHPERINVSTGITLFPKEVMRPPRSAVERKCDLQFWNEPEPGGHFPALEQPGVLIADLKNFFRTFRYQPALTGLLAIRSAAFGTSSTDTQEAHLLGA